MREGAERARLLRQVGAGDKLEGPFGRGLRLVQVAAAEQARHEQGGGVRLAADVAGGAVQVDRLAQVGDRRDLVVRGVERGRAPLSRPARAVGVSSSANRRARAYWSAAWRWAPTAAARVAAAVANRTAAWACPASSA